MEGMTASEAAGFGVGALLLIATITAPKIDSFISASQRSSLGMCKRCGDLKVIACSNCKGLGIVKPGFSRLGIVSDLYQSFQDAPIAGSKCSNCQAKGRICCPDCSTQN